MHDYLLTLLAAAAVTYLLTPLVRRFAVAVGAEHAARDRDVHVVPTPLLGGFAMYAGLAAGLLVASQMSALGSVFSDTNMAKGLLMAGGLVVIMGFVDDRWGMGAASKLAGQVAAGVILVWSGAAVTWLPEPGGGTLSLSTDEQTAVTILVVVVTINAVNFIDGLDGLAAGVVGVGAAAFFIYYYTLTQRLSMPDQSAPALASAVLAGMCLGFLPHNFHPARIFMGDTGAMLIGLLLAYAPISSLAMLDPESLTNHGAYAGGTVNRFGAILPLLLPAAILLIPYADLLMAVIRRTRAGTSPFAPDKKHLHHRLLEIGHSHRASVLIMYLWATLFSGSVVWLSIARTPLIELVGVSAACVLALLLVSMPRLRPWARSSSAGRAGPAPAGMSPADPVSADLVSADPSPAGPSPAGPSPAGSGAPAPITLPRTPANAPPWDAAPAVAGEGAGPQGRRSPGAPPWEDPEDEAWSPGPAQSWSPDESRPRGHGRAPQPGAASPPARESSAVPPWELPSGVDPGWAAPAARPRAHGPERDVAGLRPGARAVPPWEASGPGDRGAGRTAAPAWDQPAAPAWDQPAAPGEGADWQARVGQGPAPEAVAPWQDGAPSGGSAAGAPGAPWTAAPSRWQAGRDRGE